VRLSLVLFCAAAIGGLVLDGAYARDALAPTSSDTQFGLLCSGNVIETNTPTHVAFQIDLAKGRFTDDIGPETFDIVVTPNTLEANYTHSETDIAVQFRINRSTGFFLYRFSSSPGSGYSVRGSCVRTPFTGLPQAKF
jgi:hypothetical protein